MTSSRVSIRRLAPVFRDKRGLIFDLIEARVDHVGMVTFKKDAARGNHFHKTSTQYTVVLNGRIELFTKPADRAGSRVKKIILEKYDLAVIPPRVIHSYRALVPSLLLDCTSRSRKDAGYEEDTVRVEPLTKATQ